MKTIGIKLADGTFYPVLEEGEPKKRMLDLTTAKDNQTKVQIDLYRSENGTMEDAEYVDTLEVTKLNPHPNGEPELHLSVGLDENNNLTAEVVDPETGKKSETEVHLVSRTEAERAESTESDVTSAIVSEENVAETHDEATFSPDDLPDMGTTALEDMPFSFDHSEPHAASELTSTATDSDSSDFEGALPDFSDLDDDLPIEDTTLESVNFSNDGLADEATDDVIGTESPDLGGDEIQTDTTTTVSDDSTLAADSADDFSTDSFSLPDFDDTAASTTTSEDFNFDSTSDSFGTTEDSTVASDDLPDFGDDFGATDSTEPFGTNDDSTVSADSTEPESFDLPDFDTPSSSNDSDPFADFDSDTTSSTTGLDFDDLDDPAFTSSDFDSTSTGTSGSAMDFSDLYDKETLAGEHASLYDEDEEEKKTRTPVIICIICAIICVIATILLLFVVPSKYNLLASRNTNGVSLLDRFFSKEKETVVEKTVETPAQIEEPKEETKFIDVQVEEQKNEPAPEAVEDKIIIAPEPEKVVPKPTPVEERKPEVKKSADAKYHIRWGDTLWDISESYYKTPWKYPKIADYNKIKNPDLIISGTDILIPAE